jgi:hypothetical protein
MALTYSFQLQIKDKIKAARIEAAKACKPVHRRAEGEPIIDSALI